MSEMMVWESCAEQQLNAQNEIYLKCIAIETKRNELNVSVHMVREK